MTEPLVKRIAGILYPGAPDSADDRWFDWSVAELKERWGEIEIAGAPVPFTTTDYYRDIAPYLMRRFVCFKDLSRAGGLADWKRTACAIEAKSRDPRIVNIDPGYVDGARLVLASTKDHAHRVYLRDEIYAEVTLRFRFGKWVSFDYTFPDFASGVYDEFLSDTRRSWLSDAERKKHEKTEGKTRR